MNPENESEDISVVLAMAIIAVVVIVAVLMFTSDASSEKWRIAEQAAQEKLISACENKTGLFRVIK